MAITFSKTGRVYTCTSAGVVKAETIYVQKVVYMPSAANDDLVFQTDDSETAIVLKAGASDASPVQLDFNPARSLPGLKISTIDGGTAYVYLR